MEGIAWHEQRCGQYNEHDLCEGSEGKDLNRQETLAVSLYPIESYGVGARYGMVFSKDELFSCTQMYFVLQEVFK